MDRPDARPADLLLRDAPLYRDGRWDGDCLVVRDGLIAGLGNHDDLTHLVGPDTGVESLAGRWLLPAFHDAHLHPVQAGTELNLCNLTDLGAIEEYVERIASYADAHPTARGSPAAVGRWSPSPAASPPPSCWTARARNDRGPTGGRCSGRDPATVSGAELTSGCASRRLKNLEATESVVGR